MKAVLSPISLAILACAVVLAFLNMPLALVLGLAWIVTSAWSLMRSTQHRHEDLVIGENLRPESQLLLKPIKRLAAEMHELVESRPVDSAVAMVGKEVLSECDRVVRQCAASLTVHDDLRRLSRGRFEATKEIDRVQAAMATATSPEERAAMETTIAARQSELGHYAKIESALEKIDSDLKQAEAALAEMKARLALSASGVSQAEADSSELRESLIRVRAVTLSVDEAEQLIRG